MKLFPALLIGMRLNWSLGRLNRIERRKAREIKEYQPDSNPLMAESSNDGSDIGVLSSEEYEDDSLLFDEERFLKSKPCKDFVECEDGFNVKNTSQTCEEACGGYCCVGPDACLEFTGSVCKDRISCSDQAACLGANITSVVRSCNGTRACNYAGRTFEGGIGYVGEVIDSCQGKDSCYKIASGDIKNDIQQPRDGFVESIVNSCHGERSCFQAALYGSIGSIVNSCEGYRSCRTAALGGFIETIVKSCNGTQSCRSAAFQGLIEGGIVKSCNADQACRQAAALGGSIAAITKSCNNGTRSCYDAAREGTIGGVGISKACNAEDACFELARINNTKVFNCAEGEQQVYPYCARGPCIKERCFTFGCFCVQFGPLDCSGTQVPPYCPRFPPVTYNITSGLEKCCNEAESCASIGDDLPDDCIPKEKKPPKDKKTLPFEKDGGK